MKQIITFFVLIFLLFSVKGFSQKVSELSFGIGVNKLQSNDFRQHYDEECTPPVFFNLGVSHSWYRTDKKVTFNKEVGLNLQYSKPDLSSGGLGAHSYSKWQILNLAAEATVQAKIRVDSFLSIGFGPAVEYLVIGYNSVSSSYYYMVSSPTTHYESGSCSRKEVNRDYLNNPLAGIRVSVFNSSISERATLKVNLTYLWMKQDESNFYSSSYIKFGIALGFKHRKNEKADSSKVLRQN